MNKIQKTKYRSVSEFLDLLPENDLEIVEYLRRLILECIPECEEKLAYNVPYYYRHSRICFIWPASVPWGGVDKGVAIAFCRGYLIPDEIGYLEKETEKKCIPKHLFLRGRSRLSCSNRTCLKRQPLMNKTDRSL